MGSLLLVMEEGRVRVFFRLEFTSCAAAVTLTHPGLKEYMLNTLHNKCILLILTHHRQHVNSCINSLNKANCKKVSSSRLCMYDRGTVEQLAL